MQNYKVHEYIISMEFSAVNRRRPSRETPLGPGAKKDGCFRRLRQTRICYIFQVEVFERATWSEYFGSEFSRRSLLVRFDHESLDIHVAEVIIKTLLETNFPIVAAAFSH